VTGRRRPRGRRAYKKHRSPADTHGAEVALRIEAAYAGWVVIWSPWRRMFTAFGSCANERLIIDDSSVERLRALMDQAEGPQGFRRSDSGRWLGIRSDTCIRANSAVALRDRVTRRLAETVEHHGGEQA
jgi:hypothetical protein